MRIPKYYCPICKDFKNRFQVKKCDDTRTYWYECKWCHTRVKYSKDVILNSVNAINSKESYEDRLRKLDNLIDDVDNWKKSDNYWIERFYKGVKHIVRGE